ncbi:MAG: hypothetical protein Q9220_004013 [cf. Caloplaca sp. 1 TL-2023]
MAKGTKSKKAGRDSTPVAPKDINGDVSTVNELSPKDSSAPRPSRKRAGDFNDFEKDETVVDVAQKDTATPSAPPSKKSKTESTAEKKKPKPSKTDGHPVVMEKTHPGGDMVETEPTEVSKVPKKEQKKKKSEAVEDVPNGESKAPKKERKKNKSEGNKDATNAESKSVATVKGHPSNEAKESTQGEATDQAEKVANKPKPKAKKDNEEELKKDKEGKVKNDKEDKVEKTPKSKRSGTKSKVDQKDGIVEANAASNTDVSKKPKEPKSAKPKAQPRKSKGATAINTENAEADTKGKTKASTTSKAAKGKDIPKAGDAEPAPEGSAGAEPVQTMDEAPFKKLLKRERAKIPAVKASADAAEADRKANDSVATPETKEKGDKAPKEKKEKKPKASAGKDKSAVAPTAAAKVTTPKDPEPKGKKRKTAVESAEALVDAAPAGKKQKKSPESALGAATTAVGNLVNSGIEAAAQGVNAVKDLASGLGGKSIADDILEVAEGAVEEKSDKADKAKKTSKPKTSKGKGKAAAADTDAVLDHEDLDEVEDADNFEEGDQILALIKGFESDDNEEAAGNSEGFKEGTEMPQLPQEKEVKQKLEAIKDTSDGPGVIYVGRIPHGFYEPQMRAYFSQFGAISRLRLSRNRTTGASKHYAFIEFASAAVARIAAETMDTYLMFGHILKCKLVAPEQVHENLWKGANKRFKKVPWSKIEGRKLEVGASKAQWGKRVEREEKRRKGKEGKMKEVMGYVYEKGVKGVESVAAAAGGEEKAVEGVVEVETEKTVVTGGDGSMVISEQVTKTKKAGKRKAAEEEKSGAGVAEGEAKKAKKTKKSAA